MHIVLWVVQVALAGLFLMAGGFKATADASVLAEQMPLLPLAFARFIGTAEVAGALGLILPSALRIAPWLTPLAAGALAFTMASAIGFHVVLEGNASSVPVNVVLLGLTLFVAWGRTMRRPILPRAMAGAVPQA